MNALARVLWDVLCGGLIAVGLMRLAFALDASPVSELSSGRTQQADFLGGLVGLDLYITDQQMMVLRLMTAMVVTLAALWGIARALSLRTPSTAP